MSKFDSLVDNKIIQNIIIWFILFLIISIAVTADNPLLASLLSIILLAPPVYINNIFILPYFGKNILLFISLFILNTLIFTASSVYILSLILGDVQLKSFVNFFSILLLALAFGSALKIARDSFIRRQEDKKAQLQLLKAQLNPHFLFNTLNNLYGLSVVKSDKLPDLMLKLSDLLRYSLYDTNDILVPLEKELRYLENYISLEKIRLEETTEIQFVKKGSISEKTIAPMLLIVFVENAFKHLGSNNEEKNEVAINITIRETFFEFSCTNSFETIAITNDLEAGKSGIGLKNAKKRLALLYPEKHILTIERNENTFNVSLQIDF